MADRLITDALLLSMPSIFLLQYDMVYGTKLARIRKDAELMIQEQNSLLGLPNGNVTLAEVEEKMRGR